MKITAQQLRDKVWEIKARLDAGEDYYSLVSEFKPYLDEMNKRSEVVAKKFKKKFYPIKFNTLMR
jgi:hypothetical protein